MLSGAPAKASESVATVSAQISAQKPRLESILVKAGKAWATYIVLRILFLAVPFALLMLVGWPWWLCLAIAALVSLALSVIFLSKQREVASTSIYDWRNRDRTADDIAEDDAIEAATEHDEPTQQTGA